jgi:hypothetical protein
MIILLILAAFLSGWLLWTAPGQLAGPVLGFWGGVVLVFWNARRQAKKK